MYQWKEETEYKNAKDYAKIYRGENVMKRGIATYNDEAIFVSQDTLHRDMETLKGRPVVIGHQDVTPENMEEKAVGYVTDTFYNNEAGTFGCKFVIFDDEAKELINNGYLLSTCYKPTSFGAGGTEINTPYDRKVTGLNFTHLALVPNPRYEDVKIYENGVMDKKTYDNWVNPDDIESWFTTKNGLRIPVKKGQTKKQAFDEFIQVASEKQKKREQKKDDAYRLLALATGKTKDYLKQNLKKKNVNKEIKDILETSDFVGLYGDEYSSNYYGSHLASSLTMEQQEDLKQRVFDDIMTDNFGNLEDKEYEEFKTFKKDYNKLVTDFAKGKMDLDVLETKLAYLYDIPPSELTEEDFTKFFKTVNKHFNKKQNAIIEEQERENAMENEKMEVPMSFFDKVLDLVCNSKHEKKNEEAEEIEEVIEKDDMEDEEEEKDNKCKKNEVVDKRDIIRQIMAIAGKKEASEDVKTIAKLAEKLAYDKDEAEKENASDESDEYFNAMEIAKAKGEMDRLPMPETIAKQVERGQQIFG